MSANPIIAAKLEFLGTAIVALTALYLKGELSDETVLEKVADALEAFSAPVTQPEADGGQTHPATA